MSSPALVLERAPGKSWWHRIGLAAMTVARLTLGLGMLPYGISRLFDLQFQVGASSYAQPLARFRVHTGLMAIVFCSMASVRDKKVSLVLRRNRWGHHL